ncbi:IS110 family transposase [Gloeobacter violaceus]|uniref:IS110 family transposase n=1 Tax=Gloeobacter violaceus TaxID=33072 RepID=UPI0038B2CC1B
MLVSEQEVFPLNEAVLGIDIAKLSFQAALLVAGKLRSKSFQNSPTGFEQLCDWLNQQQLQHIHACMEATGGYQQALAHYLH